MNNRRTFLWVALAGPVLTRALPAAAALYEDDKNIATGDIRNITYWRLKWEMERMEEAIKERQPEGAVAVRVGGIRRSLESLMKEYPKHTGLKKWYAHAGEIEKKIDPNANRQEKLREGSLWMESGYEMTYAGLNAAKMSIAVKAWEDARDWLKQAHKQLGYLEDRVKNQERVANWSPEFVRWIEATRPEVDKLRAEVAAKLK